MNTTKRTARSFMPRACLKCGGDAFFDAGEAAEWRCLQCGKSIAPYTPEQQTEQLEAALRSPLPQTKRRRRY
jgi:predicted  nucleic acid-binding Zn-ribbon protein